MNEREGSHFASIKFVRSVVSPVRRDQQACRACRSYEATCINTMATENRAKRFSKARKTVFISPLFVYSILSAFSLGESERTNERVLLGEKRAAATTTVTTRLHGYGLRQWPRQTSV